MAVVVVVSVAVAVAGGGRNMPVVAEQQHQKASVPKVPKSFYIETSVSAGSTARVYQRGAKLLCAVHEPWDLAQTHLAIFI